MCGVVGSISRFDHTTHIEQMLSVISHRGPDAHRVHTEQQSGNFISLGHRRLSIIDLADHANQPFLYDHLAMTYNGEVYNYMEIRQELQKLGYEFTTSSDTEVVIKALHAWGLGALDRFHGMFAIGLYDKKAGKLHLIRDRVGVKPLYLYEGAEGVLFSSELKALFKSPLFRRQVDHRGLSQFMQLGYIPQDLSAFKDCRKVLPGQYVTIDVRTLKQEEKTYWNVQSFFEKETTQTYTEARSDLKSILIDSVSKRLIADVPVGLYLSGGYDSSLVAAISARELGKKLNSITVKFEDLDLDESLQARKIADHLGLEHDQVTCTEKDFENVFHSLPEIFDEPYADYSALPSLLISSRAREKFKVVLSADGGDESFWGYNKYRWYKGLCRKRNSLPLFARKLALKAGKCSEITSILPVYNLPQRIKKVAQFLGEDQHDVETFIRFSSVFPPEATGLKACQTYQYPRKLQKQGLQALRMWDFLFYLPDDILVKVDRTTMHHSLEGREPLLDHSIIEFAASLPLEYLYRDQKSKYILRDITHDYIRPEIIDFKKKGFTPPLASWLDGKIKTYITDLLSENKVADRGILDPTFVTKQVRSFYANPKTTNPLRLWSILMIEMWAAKWRPEI